MRLGGWRPLWFVKWWNARQSAKPYAPGITLQPGETATLSGEFSIPDEIHAEMVAAQVRGEEVFMGAVAHRQVGPSQFETDIEVRIGDVAIAKFLLSYEGLTTDSSTNTQPPSRP